MKKLFIILMVLTFCATYTYAHAEIPEIFKGDLRYRYQQAETFLGNTHVSTLRLRIGTVLGINDDTDLNVRLNMNQLVSGVNANAINIDIANVIYQIKYFTFTGGKMLDTFYKPGGSELILDTDFNPEGIALRLESAGDLNFFINGSYIVLSENIAQTDNTRHAVQYGLNLNLNDAKLIMGAGYYRYPNFATPFDNIQLFTEMRFNVSDFSILLYGDYVVDDLEDMDDINRASYLVGVYVEIDKFGASYNYRSVDGATLILTDTDFVFGDSHKASIRYALMDNLEAKVSYLTTKNVDRDRIQSDLVFRF